MHDPARDWEDYQHATCTSWRIGIAIVAALGTASLPAQDPPAPPPAEWTSKPVPIAIFAQFPRIDDPRISPDGKLIAAKVRSGGQ